MVDEDRKSMLAADVAEAQEPDLPDEGSHPQLVAHLDAEAAVQRLREGNEVYLSARRNVGDISPELVQRLAEEGQAPFACVVSCADSRVVPEHIFMAGLGELFCVRSAGNALGTMGIASCLYAAEHLGTKLLLVMGHTHCGAIESGMEYAEALEAAGSPEDVRIAEAIRPLAQRMLDAIGNERDPYRAAVLNVEAEVSRLLADPDIAHLAEDGLAVRGAIYHTHTGKVDFL